MTDNKNEQVRDELHRAIWAIADELRGAVDGWDFKNYVLGTMFYRYISENLTAYINEGEIAAGNTDFDYSKMSDADVEVAKQGLVEEKGFFILPSELFCNVRNNCEEKKAVFIDREGKPKSVKENLNEFLELIFDNIERSAKGCASEGSFTGLFADFDVNSNKLGSTVAKRNERLKKLIDGVADMNLGSVKDHDIDAFGDAYEYLMTMYASNAGKSGGEFFTPSDVSELLTRLGTVGKKKVNKVYDPACGSGSLLLKAEKILGKDSVINGFFGQEINITTYNLCRINMFLHDIGYDKFDIECEDTLTNPQHWDDEPFELIVSNPPYSIKWEGDDNPLLINDPRFSPAGVLAPKTKADFAFIMHCLSWLATNGTAAIVCFPGIFERKGAEQKIRQYLVDNNYIDGIIHMPTNLFFGTPTDTCILILKKSKNENSTFFIDAKDLYVKGANSNLLTEEHIDRIVDAYKGRKDIKHFCRLVPNKEIEENQYKLSVSTYVKKMTRNADIDIADVNSKLGIFVLNEDALRDNINSFITEMEGENDSTIQKLIKNFCPHGIDKKPLFDLLDYEQPTKYIVDSTNYDDSFEIPVLTAGQTFILGYTNETDGIYHASEENPVIIFDDFTTSFHWVTFDFKVKSSAMKMLRPKKTCNSNFKYLYYAMRSIKYAPTSHSRQWIDKYSKIEIFVPDEAVQDEIVKSLDYFTNLTNELMDELKERKKQYDFYRDVILNFDEE